MTEDPELEALLAEEEEIERKLAARAREEEIEKEDQEALRRELHRKYAARVNAAIRYLFPGSLSLPAHQFVQDQLFALMEFMDTSWREFEDS